MVRLPQPGADQGKWGDILNEFLSQSHNTDGSLKTSALPTLASLGGVTAAQVDSKIAARATTDAALYATKDQVTPATESVAGVIELATVAETIERVDATRAVTPAALSEVLSLVTTPASYNELTDKPIIPVQNSSLNFLVGNSGSSIPGVVNQVSGTWMARDTWANLSSAQWLSFNTGYVNWVSANPDKAVDIGVPLIPHDMDKTGANWNTLLDEVIAGSHDAEYTSMGRNLSNVVPVNGKIFARVWWEMNMNPIANNINRAKFIAAWNRAIPLIRAGFAAKASETGRTHTMKIVFCPISDGADYTAFYPDNANVDIIGLDVYGAKWGTTIPTSSELLTHVQAYLDALTTFAGTKNKPMALGEWANWQTATVGNMTSHGRGDFPEYINQIFDWAIAHNVAYLCYYNISDGGVGQTMANTPLSLAAYQTRVNTGSGGTGAVYMATLNSSTMKLDDSQVPTRLLQASLDTTYIPTLVTTVTKSAAYTAVLTDSGKCIEFTNTTDVTFTIPPNSSVAFPIGTYIDIAQLGAGGVTVTAGSGVTLRSRDNALKTGGQYASAGIRKRATDEWIVMGDLTL